VKQNNIHVNIETSAEYEHTILRFEATRNTKMRQGVHWPSFLRYSTELKQKPKSKTTNEDQIILLAFEALNRGLTG
jgi:hypothetical protein